MVLNLQREIKKKTLTYGITAVLLAIILTTIVYNIGVQPFFQSFVSEFKTFSSQDELKNFLTTNMKQAQNFRDTYLLTFPTSSSLQALAPETKSAPDHSTTNVQVAGVDEADTVKNDGQYLYVVSGSNVYIIGAYPPDQAKILSKVTFNQTYQVDIYLNGDKLVVLGERSTYLPILTPYAYRYDAYVGAAFANVYDISNKTNPVLTRTISFNGTLVGSRMIGDYVYVIVNQLATTTTSNETSLDVVMPQIKVDNKSKIVQPTEVRYLSLPDIDYYFTTVVAVNVINDAQEPTYETLLTGTTVSMYVSQSNMYLTVPNTNVWITPMGANVEREETIICRAKLDNEKVVFEAQGSVSGYVLNQFSMDEYNGFFRIATTRGWGSDAVNYLHVLDMSLDIVGTLSNIAPSERIYAARFMGDKCYLVTFRQIDPFYVIDLSNPNEPKILGYLKIPGFSGYLHPYDENHVIGIGKDGNNVKLSLFNVTDVNAPTETVPSYVVQAQWSDSTVLTDHKAFLFDKAKQLLALPISKTWFDASSDGYKNWQGAYVFDLSLTGGFVLRGNVTNIENSTYSYNSNYYVKRTLYIDNILYSVSDKKVKMNSLEDLQLIKEIELN